MNATAPGCASLLAFAPLGGLSWCSLDVSTALAPTETWPKVARMDGPPGRMRESIGQAGHIHDALRLAQLTQPKFAIFAPPDLSIESPWISLG